MGIRVNLAYWQYRRGWLSTRRLAREVGSSTHTIRDFRKGTLTRIDLQVLERLCKVLECQPGDLLVYEPEYVPPAGPLSVAYQWDEDTEEEKEEVS